MSKENNINNTNQVEKIIVVGGGSSGWISASYLAKALNHNVDITVIESDRIGKIGVGEATIPTIKEELFDFLQIPEEEWMPECGGSYKLAIKFANWKKSAKEGGDHYYHSFGELPTYDGIPITHLWINKHLKGFNEPMDYSCYSTPHICDNFKSPNYSNGKKAVHYAYHFDALKVADFLKRWSVKHGVNHVVDELVKADLHENGNIKSVTGKDGQVYEADLFVDCSGFAGFLIEKTLKEPVVSYGDSLITDSAVAINIPDDPEANNIRPYTSATALDAGWLWEIPLYDRSGNGYVYSSHFKSPDEAETEIREFFGPKVDNLDVRHIKFKSQRRRRSWVKNCICFGLSSSFLEPLESTGLYFVYAALYQFVQYFPDKDIDPALRDKFNERVAYMVEDVKDFIILHFHSSPRTDTDFWLANKHDIHVPDSLKEILALQKAGVPVNKSYHGNESLYSTLEASFDRFWTNSNFQCIFAGIDYLPSRPMPLLNHKKDLVEKAEVIFAKQKETTEKMLRELPTHYEYLEQMKRRSLALEEEKLLIQ